MNRFSGFIIILFMALISCQKTNNFSKIPQISSLSIKPNSVKAGSSSDTVYMIFHFRDGDADIGNDPTTTNYDIYLVDSRDTDTTGYFFPGIDQSVENPETGIDGNCTIKLLAAFLVPRPNHPQGDTLHYTVYIKDRAQNMSNILITPDIYIEP